MQINSGIELTLLRPYSTLADIKKLCDEAKAHGYASVCIPPIYIPVARKILVDSPVKIATAIGYPFGYSALEAKLAEIVLAIVHQADELDVVINLIALKNHDWQYLAKEINTISPVIRKSAKVIKVVIEAGHLTKEEVTTCCDLYGAAGVDFIQLGTGNDKVTTIEMARQWRAQLAENVGIKVVVPHLGILSDWTGAGVSRFGCENPLTAVNSGSNQIGGMIFENQ